MQLFKANKSYFTESIEDSVNGVVSMVDQLNVATLFEAYSFGIYPLPHEQVSLLWYSPDPRGVLDFNQLHLSKSFRKFLRNHPFNVTFNTAFEKVMRSCSKVARPGQEMSWIDERMIRTYCNFHKAGYAHSVEIWRENQLVGGLYCVYVAGVISAESMFFIEPNASKLALISLIEELSNNGFSWMDIQMVTPFTESIGGRYISRAEYYRRLEESKKRAKLLDFFSEFSID